MQARDQRSGGIDSDIRAARVASRKPTESADHACSKRSRRFIAVSKGVALDLKLIQPSCASKIFTIFNPAVTAAFYRKADDIPGDPWVDELETPIVVSVGLLKPQKKFSHADQGLRACACETAGAIAYTRRGQSKTLAGANDRRYGPGRIN